MDRYSELTKLGYSKIGPAYRAIDSTTGEPVLVKVLATPGQCSNPLDAQRVAAMAPQLLAFKSFNIARLLEFVQMEEGPAIVSEFVGGPSLLQHPEKGSMKGAAALDVVNQVLNALADGERYRIFHGDLKPSNVLVGVMSDGRPHVRVTDWGLAAARLDPTPESLVFSAPERLEGAAANARSELFSAGAVIFFLLTGMTLVQGRSVAELTEAWKNASPEHLKKIRKDLDPKLTKIILSLLEMKPEKRPASAGAVQQALAELKPPPLPQPELPPGAAQRGSQTGPIRPAGSQTGPIRPAGSQTGPIRPAGAKTGPIRPAGAQTGVIRPAGAQTSAIRPAAAAPVRPVVAPQEYPAVAAAAQAVSEPVLAISAADVVPIDASQLIEPPVQEDSFPAPRPAAAVDPNAPVAVVPMRPPPEVAARLNLPATPTAIPPAVAPAPAPAAYPPAAYAQPQAYPQGPAGYAPQQHQPMPGAGYGGQMQGYPPGYGQPQGYGHPTGYGPAQGYPPGLRMAGQMMPHQQPKKSPIFLILIILISLATLGGGGWFVYTYRDRLFGKGNKDDRPAENSTDLAEKLRRASEKSKEEKEK